MPDREPDASSTASGVRRGREGEGESSSASPEVEREERGKAEELKQTGRETAEEIRKQGTRALEEAKGEVTEQVDRGTSRVAGRLESVGRALTGTAEQLEREGEERLAVFTRGAADRLDRVTGYLRDEDPRSMMDDLEEMARSNPAVFLGGAFVAGLALGRFLRSSEPALSPDKMSSSGQRGPERETAPPAPPTGAPRGSAPTGPPPTARRSRPADEQSGRRGGHDG